MKVVLGILAVVMAAPVLIVVGIALGPAALVALFIGGFAVIVSACIGLVNLAWSRHQARIRTRSAR